MKKITIVSLASFGFLFLTSLCARLTRGVFSGALAPLIIGLSILIVSGVLAFIIREKLSMNLICFVINSIAMGILIRAWYILRGFDNSFGVMLIVSLATVIYLWVFFALSKIPFIHKSKAAYIALCVIYACLSALIYYIAVLKTETTYLSTFGYYMILELAFIFAMSLEVNTKEELIRNLTLSTYSIFLVAIIAAVVVVIAAASGDCSCDCGPEGCCDGECCECLDCGGGGGNESSAKKRHKNSQNN